MRGKMLKIAIAGKGGVGKTTLTAMLCDVFSKRNHPVIAVDADPDANLAAAFGVKDADITPISKLKELIKSPHIHIALATGASIIILAYVSKRVLSEWRWISGCRFSR